ncbi:beta-propeller fold lactonase family protein [Streptomyces sp. LX-29]|uniref:beta-propeller fold lactonase family protein n=1 Tax=Streptomyces sp. LX-29 TaxID=2900152 RepID=UPI00240E22F1|nr:beta-propeller fold lactonase family protein [Streptomyces sp. LX-29]WFB09936.1 beta-propeller fold lactonase family protein [Streptomyces sp. LX-29]
MSTAETPGTRSLAIRDTDAAVNRLSLMADPVTVTVGTGPASIAFRPDGLRAYVTNSGSGTVSVIDPATNTVSATVTVGTGPWGVAVHPDGTRAYVTNSTAGTVSVINTATNTVTATVTVGTTPRGVALTPDGTRAYVANSGSGTVSVINTATNTVTATVTVGTGPWGVAVHPDGTRAYVTNSTAGTVSVISTASNTVTATVTVGTTPRGVALTPDGTRAYVANSGSGIVSVIDTTANTVTRITTAANPARLAASPDGTLVYATMTDAGSVTVINPSTDTVTATLPGFSGPQGISTTPDGRRLYVVNNAAGTVRVLSRPAAVTPNQGSLGGGTAVTLTGRGFTGTRYVRFGNRLATDVVVVDDTTMTLVTPSGTGSATVRVIAAGGSAVIGRFYYRLLPVIHTLSSPSGPMSGGSSLTITGRRFVGVRQVWFRNVAVVPTVVSDTVMTVVIPPSAVARTVSVHTANRGGVSNSTSYTYISAPAITSISPTSGSRAGFRSVNIFGTSLSQVVSTTFGGNPAVTFKVMGDTKIQAITPAGTPGPAAVVVTTSTGATATSPMPYLYT